MSREFGYGVAEHMDVLLSGFVQALQCEVRHGNR
jgi:hypothetical protein